MNGKSTILGAVLVSVLFLLVPAASAEPWTVGQTWAYKWEKDYSTSGAISTPNATLSGTHEGKAVYAYYVEYAGMENEYYRFNFQGIHYSWANLNAIWSVNSPPSNGALKLQQKTIWVEFYGYFYMKETNISTWSGEKAVYSVYKLEYTVYSKEPVDYTAEFYTQEGNNRIDASGYAKGSFNITLTLEFENGIPFVPIDTGNYFATGYTDCNYSAHAKAKVDGKWNMSASYNGTHISLGGDININVDKEYSGTTTIWYTFSVSGNHVTRAGILGNIGTKVLDNVGCHGWNGAPTYDITRGTTNEPDIKRMAGDIADTSNSIYDPSTGYYTGESTEDYGDSKSTSKDNVNQIISNPAGIYGGYSTSPPPESNTFIGALLLFLVIGVIIVIVVVVVVVVLLMRKKQQPRAPQQAPPVYQETAPQYQYQAPQQYAPPQPAYPPQQPQQPQQPQPPTY
ncbi:MAG: hypothetical protein ACPL1Y_03275 [Thermoplasmata archaeon]